MTKTRRSKPFIYYDELKTWETACLWLYSILTLGVISILLFASAETKQITLIMYIILSQLGMYFGLYTSLRNFKSYLLWFGFGLIHLIIFSCFKENPSLETYRGDPTKGLLNTVLLLLLFQLLRFASLKLQGREFIAPSHGGGPDLFENKKVTFADYVIFFIYIGSFGGLTVLYLSN